MKLVQFLSGYVKWFHIMGQSSYSYSDGFVVANRDSQYRILNYAPSVVLLIVTTLLTSVTYILMIDYSTYNRLGYPVVAMNASTQLLTMAVAVGQSIFHSSYFVELLSQIRVVDQMEQQKLVIDLPSFRRSLLKRFILTCTSYLFALLLTFIIKPVTLGNAVVFMCLFLLRSFTVLILFHMLFYIDLFDCIIRAYVQYVDKQATAITTAAAVPLLNIRDGDIRNLMSEFSFIKFMHLHLWEISQTINNLFGWPLVVICLQYFLYAIYCVYFSLILMISPNASVAEILRNSNVFIKKIRTLKVEHPLHAIGGEILLNLFPRQLIRADSFFPGPICNFLSAVISTTILINACHYCTIQVKKRETC